MVKFDKPPASNHEHIIRLKERGMTVSDEDFARKYFEFVTYYRLCAYWLPYEIPSKTNPRVHCFAPDTNFQDIVRHYEFDRELRILLVDAIERVEIALRTRWVNILKFEYGPHSFLDTHPFTLQKDKSRQITWSQHQGVGKLIFDHRKSKEVYVKHFREKYDEALPPIWAAVEQMSLGTLSLWITNTNERRIRNKICEPFKLDEKIVISFLHHLVPLRNACAHHSRVWNRSFTKRWSRPKMGPRELIDSLLETEPQNPREPKSPFKIYNSLTMLVYLTKVIQPNTQWPSKLVDLLERYEIDVSQMGFPQNYLKLPMWSEVQV